MVLMTLYKGQITRLESEEGDNCHESLERISHDFRSPLNIIIGFSGLLLDETTGKINDEQRSALNDIIDSGNRLLGLVNKVFDTSSPEYKALFRR